MIEQNGELPENFDVHGDAADRTDGNYVVSGARLVLADAVPAVERARAAVVRAAVARAGLQRGLTATAATAASASPFRFCIFRRLRSSVDCVRETSGSNQS
jgi:hypothetical protein